MKTKITGNYYYAHAKILEIKVPFFLTIELKNKLNNCAEPTKYYFPISRLTENFDLDKMIRDAVLREVKKARKIVREKPTRHKRLEKVVELHDLEKIVRIARRQLIYSLARPNMLTCGAEDILNWIGFSSWAAKKQSRQQS